MPHKDNTFKKIANLAHLDIETNHDTARQLEHDVSAIMDYIEQLRQVDSRGVLPLFHPLDLHQRLRADEVCEESLVDELKTIAPLFDNDLFLVPQVINTGN